MSRKLNICRDCPNFFFTDQESGEGLQMRCYEDIDVVKFNSFIKKKNEQCSHYLETVVLGKNDNKRILEEMTEIVKYRNKWVNFLMEQQRKDFVKKLKMYIVFKGRLILVGRYIDKLSLNAYPIHVKTKRGKELIVNSEKSLNRLFDKVRGVRHYVYVCMMIVIADIQLLKLEQLRALNEKKVLELLTGIIAKKKESITDSI